MPRIDVEAFEEEWEEDLRPPPGKRYSVAAQDRISQDEEGRVVAVDRGRVTVLFDGEVLEATYAGSMRGEKVVVGDRVRVRAPRHESDAARITERLDRGTVLMRTADDTVDEARVVVANADQVVVVISADHLDSGARFLDRVLVAAEAGGLDAVVCVNKIDVGDPDEVAALAERYEALGYEVRTTSARTGEGIDELGWRMEGCWTALTGHSGVGKSSLYNRLVPEAEQQTGEIGRRGGRHTTVASRAEPLPGHDDAWLVDTPGVRSFGLGMVAPAGLSRCFPELAGLPCALDDCTHSGEPGCELDRAEIHPERLAAYRRLLSSLRGDDAWERDEWAAEDADADDGEA